MRLSRELEDAWATIIRCWQAVNIEEPGGLPPAWGSGHNWQEEGPIGLRSGYGDPTPGRAEIVRVASYTDLALEVLPERGLDGQIAAKLLAQRLRRQSMAKVRRLYGLTQEEGDALVEKGTRFLWCYVDPSPRYPSPCDCAVTPNPFNQCWNSNSRPTTQPTSTIGMQSSSPLLH